MKKLLSLLLCIFLFIGNIFSQIDYQKRAEKNIQYLIRDNILKEQIILSDVGIKIFLPNANIKTAKPVIDIKWDKAAIFLHLEKGKYTKKGVPKRKAEKGKLAGMRIAIDPGHFANNLETAILERKYIKIKKEDVGTKKDIAFYEADLAWRTAYILSKRLEKHGAEVLISRKKGKSSFGYTFKKWKKKYAKKELAVDLKNNRISKSKYNQYLKSDKQLARYFNSKDIANRANKINHFLPDATIIIHYNAASINTDKEGNFKPISQNYCMAFTGGGFMKGELKTKEHIEDFARLLLSSDLEKSISLSSAIIKQHEDILKVPIVANKNNISYLFRNSVYADEAGVYCRNLGLTRLIQGPLCFGESFLQENIQEAVILSLKNYKESGIRTSSRIKLVVDAYEQGILDYFKAL